MTTEVEHTDVAAYALGLLEEDDRRAFEAHLGQCTLCTEELGDFSGLAEILREVPPIEPETPEEIEAGGQVIDMLRRRKVAERSRRRGTTMLGAAAGVILLAGGAGLGMAAAGGDNVPSPSHTTPSHAVADVFQSPDKKTATNAGTGLTGMVAMQNMKWGTNVGLQLSRLRGPLVCRLVAVSKKGKRHTVSEWRVPPKGYGFPGTPPNLQVHGGTAISRADLARFDVQVEGSGRTLLSIPV